MKFSPVLNSIISKILHVISISIVIYYVWPILTLYYNQRPAVGIDLFLSVDFVTYIHNHLNWPWASWKYIWYGGTPLVQTYPLFHFYLIQPLLAFFSAVRAVQIYVLFFMVIYFASSYFLFFSLSRSRGLALVLSIATAYSFNLWSAIYWAGSIPYTATIFLLPLTLYLIVLAYERNQNKYIYFAGLLCGIFLLGHPQSFISFTVPLSTILILFYIKRKGSMQQFGKFKTIFTFAMIIFLVGFPLAGTGLEIFSGFANVLGKAFSHGVSEIAQSTYADAARQTAGSPLARILDVYRRTNPLFFWGMGLTAVVAAIFSIFTLIMKSRVSARLKLILPFTLMFLYLMLFLYAFVLGINPIAGGWFRAFWPVMTVFGAVIAVLWSVIMDSVEIMVGPSQEKTVKYEYFTWIVGGLIGISIIFLGIKYLQTTYEKFKSETLVYVELSSAFPTIVSTDIEKDIWPEKLPKLTPEWLDPDDVSFRMYDLDATVNIWWSSIYKMPLARGYLDANPQVEGAENYGGWQYWQNVTLAKNEAVEVWDVPETIAREQAKFLIDWHAIKYLEGKQSLQRPYGNLFSSYVTGEDGLITRKEEVSVVAPYINWDSFGKRFFTDQQQDLSFFEIGEQYTSPIYTATNAPSILVVGDAIGQNTIIRDIAMLGLDSKKAIIIQWNNELDEIPQKDIQKFDVIIAYRYKYNSARKAFDRFEEYVRAGGNLFIDTGTEVPETSSTRLSELFPFEKTERKSLGKNWDFQIPDNQITNDVNFQDFGEPIYNDEGWSFSYPTSSLRYDAEILVNNHNQPVLIRYDLGKGKIIWSGMNLPGHILQYKGLGEVQLFKKILSEFVDFSKNNIRQTGFERFNSEKLIIKGKDAKGVLFKEAGYSGWDLKIKSGGKSEKVKIYEAGPMVPGYMYAFVPENMRSQNFEAVFEYHGETSYKAVYLVSFLAFIITIDYLLFSKWITKFAKKRLAFIHKGVGGWWEREDEI